MSKSKNTEAQCTCMTNDDGVIETASGSCPVHSWMVDTDKEQN